MAEQVHEALGACGLTPCEYATDSGYVGAGLSAVLAGRAAENLAV